jgi:sarcosine oxidase
VPGRHEIAVVGAGIVGLATAYALSERGVRATVYEAGVPGDGQSGGESRIFRHSHDDPRLARLTIEGRGVWREWSERLGAELVSDDGVVALGEPARRRLAVLEEVGGGPVRAIDAAELAERLPPLGAYAGPATLDEAGGAIRTEAAIRALAGALGDGLAAHEVIAVRPTSGGRAEVVVGDGRREYARVVVCAGRGTAALAAGLGLLLPVSTTVHTRVTFAVRGDPPARLACLQDGSGAFGQAGAYGTPHPGNRLYSVGLTESAPVSEDAAAYVGRALPGLDPRPAGVRNCWVTQLPWGPDGMAVWEADGILFLLGNNLFKHAPRLGRALAAAAVGEELMPALRPEARLGHGPTP